MTINPTHPSRATRWRPRPASAVGVPTGARRKGRWERHSKPVQQAGCAMVDVLAAEEGASLGTSRWSRSRDCRRRPTLGCCWPSCCYRSCRSHCFCVSLPLTLTLAFPATADNALLQWAQSRTWRPVPGLLSCPARSP
jgi:hypothetical protein